MGTSPVPLAAVPGSGVTPASKVPGATRLSSRRSSGTAGQHTASPIPPNKKAKTSHPSLGQSPSDTSHCLGSFSAPGQSQGRAEVPSQQAASVAPGQFPFVSSPGSHSIPVQSQTDVQQLPVKKGMVASGQPPHQGDKQGSPGGPQPLQEANYTWVQCDLCSKWRELPKGHVVLPSFTYACVDDC